MPFCQLPDIKMFYKVIVAGKEVDEIDNNQPVMLVLHGGPGIVDHQIELEPWCQFPLTEQLVFIDHRGCGRTEDGDPTLWSIKQSGQDLKDFCDAMDIVKPIIAGISWGGYVMMSYAIQFPEHPKALILLNTEAKVELDANIAAFAMAFDQLAISPEEAPYNELGNDKETVLLAIGEVFQTYMHDPTPANFDLFVKFCVPLFSKEDFELMPPSRVNMPIREKYIRTESLTFDFYSELKAITCPVLQIAGRRDPMHPAVSAEKAAKFFPNTQCVVVEDAGCPVYVDQPEIFVKTIRKFIDLLD